MVLDTTKKPIGQTAGGTTEGDTGRKRLDLSKKPVAASGSPDSPAALAVEGRKNDHPPRPTRLAWFLAAVAAVVCLGFLALPYIGGRGREAGDGGSSANAASRKVAGEIPGANLTGSAVPAAPVSEVDAGTAGGPSTGSRPEANEATAERSVPNAAGGGGGRLLAESGREATTEGRAENPAGAPSAGADRVMLGTTAGGRSLAYMATPSSDGGVSTSGPSRTGAAVPKVETRSASKVSKGKAGAVAGRMDEGGGGEVVQAPEAAPVVTPNPESVLLTVRFELNSAAMSPEEEARIRSGVGDVAAKAPRGLVVEGFTCSLGTKEFNNDLARRRAHAVAAVLRSNAGGASIPIELRSFGEQHPVASNDTARGRSENRRVVVRAK